MFGLDVDELQQVEIDDRREPDTRPDVRRASPRGKAFLSAFILSDTNDELTSVIVRNLSETGCKLQLPLDCPISGETTIVIPSRASAYRAQVIWRKVPFTGLRFLGSGPIDVMRSI
jgi:hypothetical protein